MTWFNYIRSRTCLRTGFYRELTASPTYDVAGCGDLLRRATDTLAWRARPISFMAENLPMFLVT